MEQDPTSRQAFKEVATVGGDRPCVVRLSSFWDRGMILGHAPLCSIGRQ